MAARHDRRPRCYGPALSFCGSANRIQGSMMNRRNVFSLLLFSAFIFLASPLAWSQNISATLRGTVHDGAGSVVAGATVTVQNNGTGITRRTTTNNNGDYVVLQL